MRNRNELVWLDVVDNDFWWTNYVTGIRFEKANGGELPLAFGFDKEKIMSDTGTSCTYFPTKHYNEIMGKLDSLIPEWYVDDHGDFGIDCALKDKLPTISFLIGSYWFEMTSNDWIIETNGECWACIGENPIDDYWILGDTFLRGYYSVHKHGKRPKFGFAPHAKSNKRKPLRGSPPNTSLFTKKLVTKIA